MKLDDLTMSTVTTALTIYLDHAYGQGATSRRLPEFASRTDANPREILEHFQRDECCDDEGRRCLRFSLRLGNRNYPFMKLLLQEHIVPGEFFFAVDTHDEMDIKPDYPDYEAWMAVRRFNGDLKHRIEADFATACLDTASTVRQIIADRPVVDCESLGRSILVVDDEEDLAEAVGSLLRARGYDLHKAYDGREGVDKARALRPDLIILDYELPEMDGLEVIAALRDDAATLGIPILLCTASRIGIGDIRKADGFLAKPFQEDLLYEMVQRVIATDRRSEVQ